MLGTLKKVFFRVRESNIFIRESFESWILSKEV